MRIDHIVLKRGVAPTFRGPLSEPAKMELFLLDFMHHAGYIEEPIFFEVTAPEGQPVVRTPTCPRPASRGCAIISAHGPADQYEG
jgi:hypothetical protein